MTSPNAVIFDEIYFSKFLWNATKELNVKIEIMDADCEKSNVWLFYEGKLFSHRGECALVHFGGLNSHISSKKKETLKSIFLSHFNSLIQSQS